MEENILLTNYKNLTQEELEKLPAKDLSHIAHEALQNWDKLNQRLNQDSTNSSRSPSSDNPEAKAKRKAEQKESQSKHGTRKQGAQPGHKAVVIPLVELGPNDVAIDAKPEFCKRCGESLLGCADPKPYRRQKHDVKIERQTTEYRKHSLNCPKCEHVTEGILPKEAQGGAYGENITLLTGMLTGVLQVSRRLTKVFLENLCDIPISVGSVSNLEKELKEASLPVMEEIEVVAQNSSHGNVDETGFGKSGWLWVLVTEFAAVFRLFKGRGQEWASKLIGAFEGILTSDRWCGYNQYPSAKHQLCWAHLIRDFKAMIDTSSDGRAIGLALRKSARTVFRLWPSFSKNGKQKERKPGLKYRCPAFKNKWNQYENESKRCLKKERVVAYRNAKRF
ncbi:hypothetical protein FACS1894187_18840 [Synergistales bacterium]|nr:hypothetical protein FACS1894187_18840 [Synergistales bacterium]